MSDQYLAFDSGGQVKKFPLDGTRRCRIGRTSQNDIVLEDDLISRNHAMIQGSENLEFYLMDLGSRNGTLHNHRRVTVPVLLADSDTITIGDQELTFFQEGGRDESIGSGALEVFPETRVRVSQQLITVLVVDIRGYTQLSQRLDESTLAQTIGTFIRESGVILDRERAWTQKYIGDAVMAVWLHRGGSLVPRVLREVVEALNQLFDVAGRLQSQFDLDAPIRLGAGINSGLASVGNVGSGLLSDHTALGDVVNKTFRLESSTRQIDCDVVLGEETYEFLASQSDLASVVECHSVNLKGYDELVRVYGLAQSAMPELVRVVQGFPRDERAGGPSGAWRERGRG